MVGAVAPPVFVPVGPSGRGRWFGAHKRARRGGTVDLRHALRAPVARRIARRIGRQIGEPGGVSVSSPPSRSTLIIPLGSR